MQAWTEWAGFVLLSALACVLSAAIVKAVTASTPPGLLRFLYCLPVMVLYSSIPFLFDVQSLSRASTAAMFLWLANFKLLALCMGRGHLTQPDLTLGQFTALLLWPIIPKTDPEGRIVFVDKRERAVQAWRRLFWRAPENLAVTAAALFTITHPAVPLFAKTYSGAFGVCGYCGLWANACAALVIWAHGLQVAPSWDRPWLQTSLGDFWARRWNLPTSSSLKYLVFQPLVEGRLVADPGVRRAKATPAAENGLNGDAGAPTSEPRPAAAAAAAAGKGTAAAAPVSTGKTEDLAPAGAEPAATQTTKQGPPKDADVDVVNAGDKPAGRSGRRGDGRRGSTSAAVRLTSLFGTFALSGAMHELLLCVCTGDTSQLGKQVRFFAIQAPLVLAEQYLVKALTRAGVHLPTWLCIPVASLTLQVPALYWFWGAYFAAVTPRSSPLSPVPPVPPPVQPGVRSASAWGAEL